MSFKNFSALLFIVWLLAGCSSMQVHRSSLPQQTELKKAKIAVVPFLNYTQTPMAGESAASIANTIMQAHGYHTVTLNKQSDSDALQDENRVALQKRTAALRASEYRYLLTGDVTEWRYKAGIDAEPVVGLVVTLIDTRSGKVVYSATGSHSALSADSLSATAQKILDKLLP